MKVTFAALSILLLSVTALPSRRATYDASNPGDDTYGVSFNATNLSYQCIPHGSQCPFNLDLTISVTGETVSCKLIPLGYQSLPEFNYTACSNPAVSVAFDRVEGGNAWLNQTWSPEPGRNVTAHRFIAAEEIKWENTQVPTGRIEVYRGPAEFTESNLEITITN